MKSIQFTTTSAVNDIQLADLDTDRALTELNTDREFLPTQLVKRTYTSRRAKDYEQSQDENLADPHFKQESAAIQYQDSNGSKTILHPNPQFVNYKNNFKSLLKQHCVVTPYPVVHMIIDYGSTRVIAVIKQSDHMSMIQMYSLSNYKLTFSEKIGDQDDYNRYIKVNEIEQNAAGNKFAVAYFDDGRFNVRQFGFEQRTEEEVERTELKINDVFEIDNYSMVIDDFPDPFISCCFLSDELLFVNFFYTYTQVHYHFVWNFEENEIIGKRKTAGDPIQREMNCNLKNFPIKCFYNHVKNEIYSFYRQGQTFKINPKDLENYKFEILQDSDIGQLVLVNCEALIVQSSGKFKFFQQCKDLLTGEVSWKLYHTIKSRGSIYYIKETDRFQITTLDYVYFYFLDLQTFIPQLENVMNNYMQSSQTIIGKRVRNCIAYKTNQRNFEIYQRQYIHNLRVCVNNVNLDGAKGLELNSLSMIVVTNVDHLILYDNRNFKLIRTIPIPLLKTESREPNEIIGIQKSDCENFIAVISGKNLIMNEQKQNQLFIFKRSNMHDANDHADLFRLHKRIILKDIPIFDKVCMNFLYKKPKDNSFPTTLIFVKKENIFEMDYEAETIRLIYKFSEPFEVQPNHFVSNSDQDIFVVASEDDGVWVNLRERNDVDLVEHFDVGCISQIVYDGEENFFYFLANRKNGQIGFFLIKFSEKNPGIYQFLTMWRHRLEIGDATIAISRGIDNNREYKELIIGYKTININTYTIFVQDLSGSSGQRATLQRHESFQLWESKVNGILLQESKNFITLSKQGINIVALGTKVKTVVIDWENQLKMLHSFDSLNFLKVEPINMISFYCQNEDNRILSVEQEWRKFPGTHKQSTHYTEIFKLKIHQTTLRELLILQSFYLTRTNLQVVKLVKMQPNPSLFYKTFLELDSANMASILAFDSGSMKYLFGDKNHSYFSEEFPIIYKNKILKRDNENFYYTNAIDIGLKNNQVKACNMILDYIIKYQNSFISSYLFTKNMPVIIEKGINVHGILSSKVFNYQFDYDAWPVNHYNDDKVFKAYNGSFFHLRDKYNELFPEDQFRPIEDLLEKQGDGAFDSTKVKKIKYTINFMLQTGLYIRQTRNFSQTINDGISIMELLSNTQELEIFNTQCIQDIIEYKWNQYGRSHHFLGMMMHMLYTLMILLYVRNAYIQESNQQRVYTLLLALGVLYPATYEMVQVKKVGMTAYLSDLGNYIDMLYNWGSILNVFLQNILGPYHIVCRTLMVIIVLQVLIKTFFFLRVFPVLTPIIVMLKTVIFDLRIFMFFYVILIALLCQVFAVLGLGNLYEDSMIDDNNNINKSLLRLMKPKQTGGGGSDSEADLLPILETGTKPDPAKEYQALGLHLGEFIWTLRLSMGDGAAIKASKLLDEEENQIFWMMWLLTTIVTSVVFLNFIVAEASASYTKVTEILEQVIWQEQASLILEAEDMANEDKRTCDQYPKYIICRQVEL